MTFQRTLWLFGAPLAIAALVARAPAASGAAAGDPAASAPAPIDRPRVPITDLVTSREDADIRADLDEARAREQRAAVSLEALDARAGVARSEAAAQKREIEGLRVRVAAAKRDNRAAEAAELAATLRQRQGELRLLEQVRLLSGLELETARARRDAAKAAIDVCMLEQDLATTRVVRVKLANRDPARLATDEAALTKRIRELERKTLEAMKACAGRMAEAADHERRLAEQKLRVLDAQRAQAPS